MRRSTPLLFSFAAVGEKAAESSRRLYGLRGWTDRWELIGGQGLVHRQQAGAFVQIGTARAQDVGRRP
jgi:hypothetical protein